MKHDEARRIIKSEVARGEEFAEKETCRQFDEVILFGRDSADGEVRCASVGAWETSLHEATVFSATVATYPGVVDEYPTAVIVDAITEKDLREMVQRAFKGAVTNLRLHLRSAEDAVKFRARR